MSGKGRSHAKLQAEGCCRLCRRAAAVRPLTRHRVVPGALGGEYAAPNVVPLCRPCHDLVDNLRDRGERLRYRRMLRAALWPQEIAYAYARLGVRFDDLYPRTTREYVLRLRRGDPPSLERKKAERPVARHHKQRCDPRYGCVPGCPISEAGAVGTIDGVGYAVRLRA